MPKFNLNNLQPTTRGGYLYKILEVINDHIVIAYKYQQCWSVCYLQLSGLIASGATHDLDLMENPPPKKTRKITVAEILEKMRANKWAVLYFIPSMTGANLIIEEYGSSANGDFISLAGVLAYINDLDGKFSPYPFDCDEAFSCEVEE